MAERLKVAKQATLGPSTLTGDGFDRLRSRRSGVGRATRHGVGA
jgi:hypothetical protein